MRAPGRLLDTHLPGSGRMSPRHLRPHPCEIPQILPLQEASRISQDLRRRQVLRNSPPGASPSELLLPSGASLLRARAEAAGLAPHPPPPPPPPVSNALLAPGTGPGRAHPELAPSLSAVSRQAHSKPAGTHPPGPGAAHPRQCPGSGDLAPGLSPPFASVSSVLRRNPK